MNEQNSSKPGNWKQNQQRKPKFGNENLGIEIGTSEASLTNRIQEMEERISGIGDMIEGMDTSGVKSKKSLGTNIQEILDTWKDQS